MPAKRSTSTRAASSSQKAQSQPIAETSESCTKADAAPKPASPAFYLSEPEIVVIPPKPFIFIRAFGEFAESAPKAWHAFYGEGVASAIAHKEWTCATALTDDTKEGDTQFEYRAGFTVEVIPEGTLPAGAELGTLEHGMFAKFTLRGGYEHLGTAWGKATARARNMPGVEVDKRAMFERYLHTPMYQDGIDTPFSELYVPLKESSKPSEFSVSAPQIVTLSERTYVFVDGEGPFMEVADKLWHQWHMDLLVKIGRENQVHSWGASFTHTINDKGQPSGRYCAGGVMKAGATVPADVQAATKSMQLSGKHLQVTMVGNYENIPAVWPHLVKLAETSEGHVIDSTRPYLEQYVVDPFTNASPKQWITQFFIPVKDAPEKLSN